LLIYVATVADVGIFHGLTETGCHGSDVLLQCITRGHVVSGS